eukprot:TRINITY_DN68584_c0_g1_i1.p2 TRINITY_DN68584_c0_g1~~TRINITY_DN68584_c0_g1_i1.p2  ORF type:complete len:117 (+),score=16.25 TRINITY_DN68584_c0_g1_i1:80-430(+)
MSTYDEDTMMAIKQKYQFSRAANIAASGLSSNVFKLIETFTFFSSLDPNDFFLQEQLLQVDANDLLDAPEGGGVQILKRIKRKVRNVITCPRTLLGQTNWCCRSFICITSLGCCSI